MISRDPHAGTFFLVLRQPRFPEARRAPCSLAPIALLIALCVMCPASSILAQAGLQARFDWSMPERFGMDQRSMGGAPGPDDVRDYWITFQDTWSSVDPERPDAGSPSIHPPSWRVDLDAGASLGAIAEYRWSIDGIEVAVETTPSLPRDFPAEGKYSVTLTVADAAGNTAETTREVTVQDWLIVAVGDSYASGEGNPELGDMEWFENIVSAHADLQMATAELNRALAALRDAELGYEIKLADVQPALRALNTWDSECPSISLACVNATANLTKELVKLGFGQVSQLITKGFQYIRTQINNLVSVAQAAVNVARQGVDSARALVDGIKEEIELIVQDGAVWQARPDVPNERASHRSSLSGQALAALALERADPRTSVTFVHLAYSGARIVGSDSYLISEDGKAQLDHVKRLVGDREIDALLVSIGGNDTGFASIIESLVMSDVQICGRLQTLVETQCSLILERTGLLPALRGPACAAIAGRFDSLCQDALGRVSFVPKVEHEDLLREGLAKLRDKLDGEGNVLEEGRFTQLARYLRRAEKFPDLLPSRLYFTEYPNMTEGDDGNLCPPLLTVTAEDWRWVRDTMTVDLNTTIREEVTNQGWNFIGGIFDGFHGHGYCASDHWVVHPAESILIQGDFKGTAHPTAAGHVLYGRKIADNLLADLYTAGDITRPRAPGHGSLFRRGDSNGDGRIDISDARHVLDWLFLGGVTPPCAAASNANGDVSIDISDVIYLLGYLFTGGPEPAAPFSACGPSGGAEAASLDCATSPGACS